MTTSKFAATLLAGCVLAAPAFAQSYGDGGRIDELTERLNELIDQAERDDAADPRFLRDLRDLAEDYEGQGDTVYGTGDDTGYGETVLQDDFSDGDYTEDPAWRVTSGEFTVDDSGLRSVVDGRDQAQGDDTAALAGAVLGALLDPEGQRSGGRGDAAAIYQRADIGNAFTVDIELSANDPEGTFMFGPLQEEGDGIGYRLSVSPGGSPELELLRVTSRGTGVIETASRLPSDSLQIEWSRDQDGMMTVSVDGEEVIATEDRTFRDPFDGFVMINGGGDFSVQEVAVESRS